jgi:hypothetical protein
MVTFQTKIDKKGRETVGCLERPFTFSTENSLGLSDAKWLAPSESRQGLVAVISRNA